MNRIISLLIALVSLSALMGQDPGNKGEPIIQIITDLHISLNDTSKTSGFGFSRAYFGYSYKADEHFSTKVVLNIGSPDDLPRDATPRRFAYFREASVSYSADKLRISFGITTTRHFDYLQKFWGKRYVASEFEVLHKYGYIADIGVVADYFPSDRVSLDFALTNGEGYSQLQLDNGFKAAAGITVKTGPGYVFRFYNDLNSISGVSQYTASAFGGVDNRYVNFGAAFHFKSRYDLTGGHDAWGVSATGAVKLPENFQIFGRYDYSGSAVLKNELHPWNYLNDQTLVIIGIQKAFTQNFNLALDFQDNIPYSSVRSSSGFIFVNALFRL